MIVNDLKQRDIINRGKWGKFEGELPICHDLVRGNSGRIGRNGSVQRDAMANLCGFVVE